MIRCPRFVCSFVATALQDTRVVLLIGSRQSGKTTLVKQVATEGMPFFTFDDVNTLDAARGDPIGFVRALDRAVIDEIQRCPSCCCRSSKVSTATRVRGDFC